MNSEDSEKLATLWVTAQPTVVAFLRTVLRRPDQIDEVLQRTAVETVRKFGDYDPLRPFIPWAIGIARYKVLDFRRQQATDRHVFSDELVSQIADEYAQECAYSESVRMHLTACLEEATGRSRRALELAYGRGLDTAAIASMMDMAAGAVRTLLCRCRSALRKCIERRMAAEGNSGERK